MRVHSKSSCRTYCDLSTRDDSRIVLRSKDLGKEESFDSVDSLRAAAKFRLPLLALMVRFFFQSEELFPGITMETFSEAPAGAGISGSSSLMISASVALNKLTRRKYSMEKLREVAQNMEAQVIRVPTGSQDYYPAMYGGVSAMQMSPAGIDRQAVPVDLNELNSRFVLAYTGVPRNSGINNLLREEWANRRRNSPAITTDLIDQLIASTRRVGSTGAKVCGAGGGGCVFFLIEPGTRDRVTKVIEGTGAKVLHSRVAPQGVRVDVAE